MSGRSSGFRLFALAALALAPCLRAQTSPKEQFDDLSKRAQAALDTHPDQAIELYKQALAIRPDWPEGWLYMGGALYELHRYPEATDALRKGLDLAPVFANGWALLGLCEAELDDQDQALADIRKGEKLGLNGNVPFETAARLRAAELLIRQSAFDEALVQLQPLTKYPNPPAPVQQAMGLCALASADDLAQLPAPRRAVVDLAGKAAWAFAGGQKEPAAAAYRQLLAQYPGEPGVHYAYGVFLLDSDANAALAEFQKEVQLNAKHWPAMLAIATIQIRQGMPEKAIETVRAATKSVPVKYRWLCHFDLGHANLAAKNPSAAIGELEDALRQMPSDPAVHSLLAEAYAAAGRPADAEKQRAEVEKARSLDDSAVATPLHPFGFPVTN